MANPSVLKKIRNQFLTWFGDIKVFKPLPFLPTIIPIYDPGSYRVTPKETRLLESFLQPGDILIRGYTQYLDGMVIPGFFSHVGLYLGPVTEADLNHAGQVSEKQASTKRGFATGAHMVAHSMAEGVFLEDLIGFCRADYLAVLRLPATVVALPHLEPFQYSSNESETPEAILQKRLLAAGSAGISFAQEAWPIVKQQALVKLGASYDFGFDFRHFNDLSCTEYVHWCLRSLQTAHGIAPKWHQFLFYKRYLLAPDDLIQASGDLQHIWHSQSITPKQLQKVQWRA